MKKNSSSQHIYLASTSIYRKELLKKIIPEFQQINPEVDEEKIKEEVKFHGPRKLSQLLAKAKGLSAFEKINKPGFTIIASDQVCALEEKIFSKPQHTSKAIETLQTLMGKTHELHTSVCVLDDQSLKVWTVTSKLTMRSLTLSEIKEYLKKDQPFDCAGAYKYESYGISLFSKVQTSDFYSIIGLPLLSLSKVLREKK